MDLTTPLLYALFIYLVFVFSIAIHEFAHAWMAYRLGDATAKDEGRLTFNPIAHLDLFGTVLIPLMFLLSGIFSSAIPTLLAGWAKPVPYNPHRLSDQKYGSLKVGFAGPIANLLVALALGLFFRFFSHDPYLFTSPMFFEFLGFIVEINIFLALFNLLPIPPLDGSKLLMDLHPRAFQALEQLGFLGLIIALFLAFYFLSPIADFVFGVITGVGL